MLHKSLNVYENTSMELTGLHHMEKIDTFGGIRQA